jgi:trk system potassium uptake protein TrkH
MTSFILHYRIILGEWGIFKRDEAKYALVFLVLAIIVTSVSIWGREIEGVDTYSAPDVLRKTSFHVISAMSTCGYNTVDFGEWPDFAKALIVGLMYVGGMSSSTAGGIRVIRFLILLKAIHYSLKKLVLPKSARVLMKIDGRTLKDDMVTVVGYTAAYLSMGVFLAMALMLLGIPAIDSLSTIMSAMGNDGLNVLSGTSWYGMHYLGKLTIIFAMWIGRIEIYPGLLVLRALIDRLR